MVDVEQVKQNLIDIVHQEYRCGMVNMFEGNVSARVGDRIFITPSQVAKLETTKEMLIELAPDGTIVYEPEGYKVSSEYKMHLEVYRLRPDVKAVVHNHSLYATAFALNGTPIESKAITEMNQILGDVPVVPYGRPSTDAISAGFKDLIGNRYALLLANHGVITFGASLNLAYSYAEAVEKTAQMLFVARQMGKPADLPESEVEWLKEFGEKKRDREIAEALKED